MVRSPNRPGEWQHRAAGDPRFAPAKGDRNANPPGIGLGALIAEDYRTHDRDWFSEGFWTLFWHRIGNARMGLPKPLRVPATLLYRMMFRWVSRSTGIYLPYTVRVGRSPLPPAAAATGSRSGQARSSWGRSWWARMR